MNKVKDAVSKFFNPSFLFSTSNDTDRTKRKRSTSTEDNSHEPPQETTTSKYIDRTIRDAPSHLIDEEDDDTQDMPPTKHYLTTDTEQEKKRRRTGNYQSILTTNSDERISSYLTSTDTHRRSDYTKSNEQNYNERIDRILFTPTRAFDRSLTHRDSLSNYDPSKSPLFVDKNPKPTQTTTDLTSNEFSANHLLATGLNDRSQISTAKSQQPLSTLTKPIINRSPLLSNERQTSRITYSSINSHRLPYIERLRRRTLKDCIRFNQTFDNEPSTELKVDEQKSKPTSTEPKPTKVQERECGIQCDISIDQNLNESNNKNRRAFPPVEIQHEVLSVPDNNKTQSSTEESSSVRTVENLQPTIPDIDITKPKVLGNITPFSWPKFARAQEEYAKKHPEKCTDLSSSTSAKSKPTSDSIGLHPTNLTSSLMPKIPLASTISIQSTWNCPSCTKENSIQTQSCLLCHGINPNNQKLKPIASTITVEKEPITSKQASSTSDSTTAITTSTKETSASTSSAVTTTANSITIQPFGTTAFKLFPITTKESSLSSPASVTTTSNSINLPPFNTNPLILFPTVTKESSLSTSSSVTTTASNVAIPTFGTSPLTLFTKPATTTKENTSSVSPTLTTNASSVSIPPFGTAPLTIFPTPAVTTKESSIAVSSIVTTTASSNITPTFGTTPLIRFPTTITTTKEDNLLISSTVTTTANTSTMLSFGTNPLTSFTAINKENSTVTSTPMTGISLFGTSPLASNTTPPASLSTVANANPVNSSSMPFSFGLPATLTNSATTSSSSSMVTDVSMSTDVSPTVQTFGSFGGTSTPLLAPVSTQQSNPFPMQSTISTSSIPTNPFASSNTSAFVPQIPTTTAPFRFGVGFNFQTSSTAGQSNSSFGISPARPNFFGQSGTSSTISNPTSTFGISSASTSTSTVGNTAINLPPSLNTANSASSQFSFGIAPNTTTNPFNISGTSFAPAGGFSFPSQTSSFGTNPSESSSSRSSGPFVFGTTTFAANATSSHLPIPMSSSSNNPTTHSDEDMTNTPTDVRQVLKAKRRKAN